MAETMTPDKKTTAKPIPMATPKSGEPVLVKVIQFDATAPIGLPGKFATSVTSEFGTSNRDHHEVEYLPWLRHFAITYVQPSRGTRRLVYVHETRIVQWEPLV